MSQHFCDDLACLTGISPDMPHFQCCTPLHVACMTGHLDVVDTLLAHGADPRWSLQCSPFETYTALHFAAVEGHRRVVDRLLAVPGGRGSPAADAYGCCAVDVVLYAAAVCHRWTDLLDDDRFRLRHS